MKPTWHWSNQKNRKGILDRISKSKKGQHTSVATEFKVGQPNPFRGKKLPWAKKAELARKGKCGGWNKGIPMTKKQKKKLSKALKGRKCWNKGKKLHYKVWNTGLGVGTPLNHAIRRLPEYKEWQQKILKRDNYTCQICNKRGDRLHIDHIKAFALICKENKVKNIKDAIKCKLLWDIKNGRVLCASCHRKTETYAGKVNYSSLWKSINRV